MKRALSWSNTPRPRHGNKSVRIIFSCVILDKFIFCEWHRHEPYSLPILLRPMYMTHVHKQIWHTQFDTNFDLKVGRGPIEATAWKLYIYQNNWYILKIAKKCWKFHSTVAILNNTTMTDESNNGQTNGGQVKVYLLLNLCLIKIV